MKQPMRTRSRRCPPKILGNTARAPQPLRSLGGPSHGLGAAPLAGRPGVRNFPRARHAAPLGECHRSIAVTKYLERRRLETARKPEPEPENARGARKGRKPWRGRPGQEGPTLAHSPAVARPAIPPLREGATTSDTTPWTARRNAARMSAREHARLHPSRPRPSRVLAELADANA